MPLKRESNRAWIKSGKTSTTAKQKGKQIRAAQKGKKQKGH